MIAPRRLAPVHPLDPYAVIEAKTFADVMRLPAAGRVRLLHEIAESLSCYPASDAIHGIADAIDEERREDEAASAGYWADLAPSVARQLARGVL